MAIESFIQGISFNRQVGEGRIVQDSYSYVVPWPTSAQQIAGWAGSRTSHVQLYGAGAPTPMATRYPENVAEVPIKNQWLRLTRFTCDNHGPLGMPFPIFTSTPVKPVGKSSTDLPPGYYAEMNPRMAGVFTSITSYAADLGFGSRVPLTQAADLQPADPFNFILQLKYMLLEPPVSYSNLSLWQLWTIDEILSNINRRLERFCLETGITKKVVRVPYFDTPQPVQGNYLIPSDSLDVRRVSYKEAGTQVTIPLKLADQHTLTNGLSRNWQSLVGSPIYWLKDFPNAGQIKVVPAPVLNSFVPAIITYHYVPRPDTVTLGDFDALAPIPPCFLPYIRWGVLSDLLGKQGEANDPVRQAYCDQRWQEGVELAKALLGRLV